MTIGAYRRAKHQVGYGPFLEAWSLVWAPSYIGGICNWFANFGRRLLAGAIEGLFLEVQQGDE